MNKKQGIIFLVVLLYFSFVHVGILYSEANYSIKRGEFSSLVGIFNSKLNIIQKGEFTTKGLFSKESFFEDIDSKDFKSSAGIFNQSGKEYREPESIFKAPQGEFSSAGLF